MRGHHTIRSRVDILFATVGETAVEAVSIFLAVAQLFACFGFYSWVPSDGLVPYYTLACWVFFTCAAVTTAFSLHSLADGVSALASTSNTERAKLESEIIEMGLYVAANVIFASGSIAFLPSVSAFDEELIKTAGTWLFLLGSLGFVLAAFFNAVKLAMAPRFDATDPHHFLSLVALGLNMLGAALFLSGTIGYFPQLENETSEWVASDVGTHLYVSGAAVYAVAAITTTVGTHLKTTPAAPATALPEAPQGRYVSLLSPRKA